MNAQHAMPRYQADNRGEDVRFSLDRSAILTVDTTKSHVSLANITRDGCKLIGQDMPVKKGTIVEIGIGGIGTVSATVAWRVGDAIGCAFHFALIAGAVSAAMENNVRDFPVPASGVHGRTGLRSTKWSSQLSVLAIVSLAALCWVPLAMILARI